MNMPRHLSTIAADIFKQIPDNWGHRSSAAALPYLNAMRELKVMSDMYGHDKASHIVRYFLANAGSWRGEMARAVKLELNAMLARHEGA